jgi:hypothetical protein
MIDHKQWAYDLKAREERGEKLGRYQQQSWRIALKHNPDQPEKKEVKKIIKQFKPA